jgi:hypothetical protein
MTAGDRTGMRFFGENALTDQQFKSGAAPSGPITVTYEKQVGPDKKPQTFSDDFDLLIVACEPFSLPFKNEPNGGSQIFSRLRHYQIHCSILKVKRNGCVAQHGLILSPDVVSKMDGTIYAFRNETAKQYGLAAANDMDENLIAVYQLRDPWRDEGHPEWTEDQFQQKMFDELQQLSWWPYGPVTKDALVDVFMTDYFNRFTQGDLELGLPWDILDLQGKKQTFYVHGSTCFESALDCWQYANLLFDPAPGRGLKLPQDKDSRILIVGAGVSGLLFAERLHTLKYTNVCVMEKLPDPDTPTADLYGKTQTRIYTSPKPSDPNAPHAGEDTIGELGTCYLSVAYQEMADYLQRTYVKNGNERRGFFGNSSPYEFTAMVGLPDMGPYAFKPLNFSDYVTLRAQQERGWKLDPSKWLEVDAEIAFQAVKYIEKRAEYFGTQAPMPSNRNTVDWKALDKTFERYLRDNGMSMLLGAMEYAYSVQGYGPMKDIPAYYGMVWISGILVWRMIKGEVRHQDLITYWSKGWGDVWKQMVEAITADGKVRIEYGITITEIDRGAAV